MPPPRAPWTTAILARLDDGPATLDELVVAAAHLVPPGRAHRAAERHADRFAAGRGADRVPRPMSDHTVTVGRRDVIRQALYTLRRRGVIHRLADGRYAVTPW